MALVRVHDVLDAASERAQLRHDLIRLFLRHARVVAALQDEHRTLHLVDVRDRRALDEHVAVLRELADPAREEPPPVRLRVLEHRHEVRDAEDVDRAAPDIRYLRHAEQRREAAVRATVDGEP